MIKITKKTSQETKPKIYVDKTIIKTNFITKSKEELDFYNSRTNYNIYDIKLHIVDSDDRMALEYQKTKKGNKKAAKKVALWY